MPREKSGYRKLKEENEALKRAAQNNVAVKPREVKGDIPEKLPGIWECKRLGTVGIVFVSFDTGKHFWFQLGKTTHRREVIDLFDRYPEQYPWRMGKEDKHGNWHFNPEFSQNDPQHYPLLELQFLIYREMRIVNVKDVERVKNDKRSKEKGKDWFDWFVVTPTNERVQLRTGNGLFGYFKRDMIYDNVQDCHPDGIRALWPNRTMNTDWMYGKDSGFSRMNLKPVELIDQSESQDQEPAKVSVMESGKLGELERVSVAFPKKDQVPA